MARVRSLTIGSMAERRGCKVALIKLYATRRPAGAAKVRLRVLGSVALMLQADYNRGTKDGDVLESAPINQAIKTELLGLGGKGTALAKRHDLYLDIVAGGILFLPAATIYHPLPGLSIALNCFDVEVMDIQDACVTKLKRFNANDQTDIAAMTRLGKLDHACFLGRFHQVERAIFLVTETHIDLRTNPYETGD